MVCFFFSSRRRHTSCGRDWSSDVCSSDLGVSCAADRQAVGRISKDGVFLEQLETNPAQYLPEIDLGLLGGDVVKIDLNRPMAEIRKTLANLKITTRVSLTGPLIVARDLAHAKIKAETI